MTMPAYAAPDATLAQLPPGWRVHEVAAGLRLRIGGTMPALPVALEAEINGLWMQARTRRGGVRPPACRCGLAGSTAPAAHAASGNAEYPALEVVATDDLPGFVRRFAGHLTQQAPVFLAQLGLLAASATPV